MDSILKTNARASFAALQDRLRADGRIAIAVQPLGGGQMEVLGGDPAMRGMSTTKVLILAALLRSRGGVDHVTPAELELAHSAISESDNQAILRLFAALERDRGGLVAASAYATGVLRDAGDSITTVATAPPPTGYVSTFGQTPWRLTESVMFFRALARGCLLPTADTSYVLRLMRSITPSDSWGLGSAGFTEVAFKGGWGPEAGGAYGVRQSGIIGSGDQGAVVAILADPVTTFSTGTSMMTDIACWLRTEIRLTPRPRRPAEACDDHQAGAPSRG
jgi:hypothetical protein